MKISNPYVTIIIPCYNQAVFLTDALASIQSQTLQEWECLIVDDGSPDNTGSVARFWAEKDSRFIYLHKENEGLSSSRNFGLKHARGRYIQFLDSDDVILPNKLQLQVQQITDCPSHSLSFCDYSRGGAIDIYSPPQPPAPYLPPTIDGGVITIRDLAADWETSLSIPVHCFLLNRIFFDEGILFDESLENHEDWDCWMQIFSKAVWIGYIPEKLAIYRYHQMSMCRNSSKMKEGFLRAIDKQLASDTLCSEVKAILTVKRAEMILSYDLQSRNESTIKKRLSHLFHRIANRLVSPRFGS